MRYDANFIDEYFHKFTENMSLFLPDGPMMVDIDLLEKLDLLNLDKKTEPSLTRYFNVLESQEKITLINDEFIIWIAPDNIGAISKTLVLIALNKDGTPHLELSFITSDIYNSSKLVLRILEKLLYDIQENEETLRPYTEKI